MSKSLKILLALTLLGAELPAAQDAPGRTWALLIGISQYQKLPRDLWLQYADADAQAFRDFPQSNTAGKSFFVHRL